MSEVIYETSDAAVIGTIPITGEAEEPVKKPRRKKKKIIILLIVVLLIAAAAVYIFMTRGAKTVQQGASYADYTVATRDITLNLSGTGSLKPADSYTVTTLISGEILGADFEEGDVVEKDTTLYEVDSSDVATSIEQAQNALAQTQRSYDMKLKSLDDLNVKATETGTVVSMLVEVGDKVTAGQTVANIRNSAVMSLVVPFGTDDADGLYVGQSAEVTLDSTFERLSGTVTKIGAIEERLDGNMLVKMVTVEVMNPGGISPDQVATATAGGVACNGSGTFSYKGEKAVTASASGEVSAIHVKEGGSVAKNQVIITLSSDALQNDILNGASSLRDSELSLENRYSQLDNYTIKSPIAGTIIEKNYKEGDTLESGKVLCTIFDLSYLTMTLNVDELDISSIEAGQQVAVTAEALPGRSYSGYVTKVNINGTTVNGVTSYPVTIRIDETEGLLPGMNVQASIVVSQSKDTVAIPVGALSRGNRVLVKSSGASVQTPTEGQGMQQPDNAQIPDGAQIASGGRQIPEGGMQIPEGMTIIPGAAVIPEGYAYVQVTPGISDGEYIEILDGLKAGDIIAVPEMVIPEAQGFFGMMPAGNAQRVQTSGGGEVYTERTVVVGG